MKLQQQSIQQYVCVLLQHFEYMCQSIFGAVCIRMSRLTQYHFDAENTNIVFVRSLVRSQILLF